MDNTKFEEFINYTLRANRLNCSVIEIFQTLEILKDGVITELVHLKPHVSQYQFKTHLESLNHDLEKLDYAIPINYSKINPWLKKYNTSKKEFLLWHTENPNASHWQTKDPPNNMLFEILYTHLDSMANLEYPNQEIYSKLNNLTYSDLQLINNDFENFIKSFYVNELIQYIGNQINPKMSTENRYVSVKHKFHGTQTQFIELVKSLIENNSLKGAQKDIIKDLATFFDIEINNPDKLIQDLKRRNNGSETLFLDALKSSLFDFIKK